MRMFNRGFSGVRPCDAGKKTGEEDRRLKAKYLGPKREQAWEKHRDRDSTVKKCKLFLTNPLIASGRRAFTLTSVMESSSELLNVSSPAP